MTDLRLDQGLEANWLEPVSRSVFPRALLGGTEWGRRNVKNYILAGVRTARTASLCAELTRACGRLHWSVGVSQEPRPSLWSRLSGCGQREERGHGGEVRHRGGGCLNMAQATSVLVCGWKQRS